MKRALGYAYAYILGPVAYVIYLALDLIGFLFSWTANQINERMILLGEWLVTELKK